MACSDGVPEICIDTTPVNRNVCHLNSGDLFRVGASAQEVKCGKTSGEVKIMCMHSIRAGGGVCRAADFFYCYLPHNPFSKKNSKKQQQQRRIKEPKHFPDS